MYNYICTLTTKHSFKQYPSRRRQHSSLFLQLQMRFSVDSAESLFTLCCLVLLDIFFMQQ